MAILPGAPSEHRHVARRAVWLPCELITSRYDEPLLGRCSDLSPRGMALRSDALAEPGETVVLSFHPPRSCASLTLFGRVRHARGPLRVEFEALTTDEHICLFDALRGIPPRLPSTAALRL